MQNEQRNQRIIEHIQEAWQDSQQLSADALQHDIAFIIQLQDEYQTVGLEALALQTVNNLSLHIIDLMVTFQQCAEKEGINIEDRQATLQDVMPDAFRVMAYINKHLLIRSLDDLVTCINIITSLQRLSHSQTADEAQSWLYELPMMCYRRLMNEKLVIPIQKSDLKASKSAKQSPQTRWTSSYEAS